MDFSQRRPLDETFVSEIVGQPIKKFTVAEGAKKGDNVIAKLTSLAVETETGEILDVVVKSLLPLTGEWDDAAIGQSQFFVSLQVFPTEMTYYSQVRPFLQQVTNYKCNIPKIFSGNADGLTSYIALEDLRPKGYKMADKKRGLTLIEVTKTLEQLALLHANSYAALQQDNPAMQEIKKSPLKGHIWSRKLIDVDQEVFFNTLIGKMVEVMKEIGETSTASKMERFINSGYRIIMELFSRAGHSSKYFQTVLHGDLWTNNILFKYASDGENVDDLTFIDFQQCRIGTIYEDLLYFIFCSTTADFRKNHLRICLQTYFKAFEEALQSVDGSIPLPSGFTEEELIATFYENIEYGFSYELIAIPFQLSEEKGPSTDQEQQAAPPPEEQQRCPPDAMSIVMMMCEMMKQGTKNSPIALLRLKEVCAEMMKLNVL